MQNNTVHVVESDIDVCDKCLKCEIVIPNFMNVDEGILIFSHSVFIKNETQEVVNGLILSCPLNAISMNEIIVNSD